MEALQASALPLGYATTVEKKGLYTKRGDLVKYDLQKLKIHFLTEIE